MWNPADSYAMTGSLPDAGLAPGRAQRSAGLMNARLPVWMPDPVCGKKVVEAFRIDQRRPQPRRNDRLKLRDFDWVIGVEGWVLGPDAELRQDTSPTGPERNLVVPLGKQCKSMGGGGSTAHGKNCRLWPWSNAQNGSWKEPRRAKVARETKHRRQLLERFSGASSRRHCNAYRALCSLEHLEVGTGQISQLTPLGSGNGRRLRPITSTHAFCGSP